MDETGPDETFAAFLAEGRFMIQQAVDGSFVFYPRVAAPGTGEALDWVEANGGGAVYATTVVRKRPPEPSYNVAIVQLVEGPRMMSRVVGIEPDKVTIGMAVHARIELVDESPVILFEPVA